MNVQDIAQDWFESVDRERISGKGLIGLNGNIASRPATLLDLCFVAEGAGQLGLAFGEFELRRFVLLSCNLTDQQDLGVEKTGGLIYNLIIGDGFSRYGFIKIQESIKTRV